MVTTRHRFPLLLAALLLLVAVPQARASGLVNPSFENGLTGWTASAPCGVPNGVCSIGTDTFTAQLGPPSYGYNYGGSNATRNFPVSPIDGNRMARLGGPFTSSDQPQPLTPLRLEQVFVVDPAHPVLALNSNVFAYDF